LGCGDDSAIVNRAESSNVLGDRSSKQLYVLRKVTQMPP
jgi:hypothetical protein